MRKQGKPKGNTPPDNASPNDGYQGEVNRADALLTTSQAARMAGVSPSTIVRHRAELGAVPGPGGAFLIQTEVLRKNITTLRRHVAVTALGPTSGEVASAVFAALKEGRHPSDIVIEQRVSPDAVMALRDQFEQMHGRKPGAPRAPCRCGSGRPPSYCFECVTSFDLAMVERRTVDGGEQVRLVAQLTWGRLPTKRPGRFSQIVTVDVASEWMSLDSNDGQDLVDAIRRDRLRGTSASDASADHDDAAGA
jgi:hypothetical protein